MSLSTSRTSLQNFTSGGHEKSERVNEKVITSRFLFVCADFSFCHSLENNKKTNSEITVERGTRNTYQSKYERVLKKSTKQLLFH